MRDIKFRAWHKDSKAMMSNVKSIYSINDSFKDSNLIYMQYTGLKDSHGSEIYEGDIIKKDDEKFLRTGIVSFIHGCWMVASESGEQYFNLHHYCQYCDIIGNIYENPELIGAIA